MLVFNILYYMYGVLGVKNKFAYVDFFPKLIYSCWWVAR